MLSFLMFTLHITQALASTDGGMPDVGPLKYTIGSDSKDSKDSKDSDSKDSDSKDSDSKDTKDSGVSSSGGKVFKSFKIGGWKVKPYISPGGGVQVNGSDLSGVVGVDAGLKYSHKKWAGDLYAGGAYTTGGSGGTSGYDVHIGDETGARFKLWGATLGLVGAYNGYLFADGTAVAPSASASVPVKLTVGPKKYNIFGGIAPVLTSDKSRQVDWNKTQAVGFGDEFTWTVGAGVKFKAFSGKVSFTQYVYGNNGKAIVVNTPTISVGLGDILNISQ